MWNLKRNKHRTWHLQTTIPYVTSILRTNCKHFYPQFRALFLYRKGIVLPVVPHSIRVWNSLVPPSSTRGHNNIHTKTWHVSPLPVALYSRRVVHALQYQLCLLSTTTESNVREWGERITENSDQIAFQQYSTRTLSLKHCKKPSCTGNERQGRGMCLKRNNGHSPFKRYIKWEWSAKHRNVPQKGHGKFWALEVHNMNGVRWLSVNMSDYRDLGNRKFPPSGHKMGMKNSRSIIWTRI